MLPQQEHILYHPHLFLWISYSVTPTYDLIPKPFKVEIFHEHKQVLNQFYIKYF